MKYFLILFGLLSLVGFTGITLATHDNSYNHSMPFGLSESNYQFIDFSYTNKIGEPIKFILEKTRDGNCNSYNAEVIDDNGNFIWRGGSDISCDPDRNSSSIPVQTKIGYNENHPIIINDSGKYYLDIEFDDVSIMREFAVIQNHGGGSTDRIPYPVPQMFEYPLKQIKNGVALIDVQCNEGKYLSYKADRMRVACVSEETQNALWLRGWATMRLMMPGDNISHALCNNYDGKWHPKYEGCRGENITDLQCSLMNGEFVDNLKICYDGICPVDKTYTLCVTNLDLISGEKEDEK